MKRKKRKQKYKDLLKNAEDNLKNFRCTGEITQKMVNRYTESLVRNLWNQTQDEKLYFIMDVLQHDCQWCSIYGISTTEKNIKEMIKSAYRKGFFKREYF